MESIGSYLKKIRQEKNLSLEDIKEKTKLSLDVLTAIEEDRFTDYTPVYVKGFLKIYCKFLGIDLEDLISEYEKKFISQEKEIISKKPSRKLKLSLNIHPKAKRIILSVLILLTLAISLLSLLFIFERIRTSSPTKIESPPKEETVQKKELRIALRAKEDCWLRVKVDGKLIFQSVLKKGRQESWKGKERIELDVGNAGALILEVNGRVFSPLGRRGQVIKDILITKEGLSIK